MKKAFSLFIVVFLLSVVMTSALASDCAEISTDPFMRYLESVSIETLLSAEEQAELLQTYENEFAYLQQKYGEPIQTVSESVIGRIKAGAVSFAGSDAYAFDALLEQISALIFKEVEEHPEKRDRIRTFFDYYLPTTLKILNAYDRMGEQGVAGENITSTMHKVESMMATIITAFEKQLDNLFGAEAMDISTDMVVLENMIAREGLTDDPLHRTAAASAEDTPEDGGITLEL